MYFNKLNNFFHGIMFHHFHDHNVHKKGQGSISQEQFYKLLEFIGIRNIINSDIFFQKFFNNKLSNKNICLTFDDAIKSQIDIALPVLKQFKIKAFFFINTSIFTGNPDKLEVYRHFRLNKYKSVNIFYNEFYKYVPQNIDEFLKKYTNQLKKLKLQYPHYSFEDLKFRLIRDILLTRCQYDQIMTIMMNEKKFVPKNYFKYLFFSKEDLKHLFNEGHTIGLHTHTHPTNIASLTYNEQLKEYKKCISTLSNIIGESKSFFNTMSHPCGSYNKNTLNVLSELNVKLGFKNIMSIENDKGMKKINNSQYEIARQDHGEIIKRYNI